MPTAPDILVRTTIIGVGLAMCPFCAHASHGRLPEAQVKAAFVVQLAQFVAWPRDTIKSTFDLCLAPGRGPLAQALAEWDGRRLQEREIRVVHIEQARDLAGCDLVVFPQAVQAAGWSAWLRAARSTLTVGEGAGFAAAGGMAGLVVEGERIVIEINIDAVRHAGFKVSARLLRLARIIEQGGTR